MILNSSNFQTSNLQNLIGPLDLRQVVIGYTDGLNLSAFGQRDEHRRPPLYVHRIMNPVDVYHIGVQADLSMFLP